MRFIVCCKVQAIFDIACAFFCVEFRNKINYYQDINMKELIKICRNIPECVEKLHKKKNMSIIKQSGWKFSMGGVPAIKRKTVIGGEPVIQKRYKDEITKELAAINMKREVALAFSLIVILSMILVVSLMNLDTPEKSLYVSLASNWLHIVLMLGAIIFLTVVLGIRSNLEKNIRLLRLTHFFIINFVMVLCSIIAVNNELAGQRPFSYLTAMLCIGSVVLMPPFERIAVYVFSWAIYLAGMILWVKDPMAILQNLIFVTLLTLVSLLISRINYSAYINNFTDRKTIEENTRELDRLYRIAEESLIKRTEELNQAIELEKVRTAFFNNISHELRTPLNIIFSTEQILECALKREQLHSDKIVDRYMKIMKQNCYRLIRLIDNLMDMTKIDAGYMPYNPKSCDIVKIIEDITLLVVGYIGERDISITFDTDVEESVISCDPEKVERIMLNLLSNAIKFTTEGGQIFVNIHDRGDRIILTVKDTGIGIPETMTEKIFERFVQVDKSSTRAREGSGIGLSIVKSFVEMHEGSISVKSELGKGSEFIVEIPVKNTGAESSCEECGYMDQNRKIENISMEFSDIYDL